MPFGAEVTHDAPALAVVVTFSEALDIKNLADALPDPDALEAATLVFVLPYVATAPSLVSRLFATFGVDQRPKVSRELRASALVARGFVRVGAGTDPATRLDLAWGYAPDEDSA